MASYPLLPYGVSDFRSLRRDQMTYVDKTRFIRNIERHRHAFLIRPRRFGKSLWVSALECYYDRAKAHRFEELFGGTDIGADPTPNRSKYVVLRFDFSVLQQKLATLEERFEQHCERHLRGAMRRNPDLFPDQATRAILSPPDINGKLDQLFEHANQEEIPICVLIDEYDNFANNVLAHQRDTAYHEFTHGGGFFRSFFATLKAGTARGGIERLFMTGVSPITLDDVTSGFNIADNVTLEPAFAEMLGFTEAEVREMLATYRDLGVFNQDVEVAMDTMREWYDGYRFSEDAPTSVYNPDMVLHYLNQSIPNRPRPRQLIDNNVRIDYGKLRHLMVVSRRGATRFNGNFDLLREVVGTGRAEADIKASFPLERLTDRDNFISLLYYFGLLSVEGPGRDGTSLVTPNQTVRRLLYVQLRDAYEDGEIFRLDSVQLRRLVGDMAEGDWRPLIEYLQKGMVEQSGVRAFINGEAYLLGFLSAHFGWTHHFVARPERELNMGYADIVLYPRTEKHPKIRCGYVIELKYLKRGTLPTKRAGDAEMPPPVTRLLDEARGQLRRYLAAEELRLRCPAAHFKGVALVFHGWELVASEEVVPPAKARTVTAGAAALTACGSRQCPVRSQSWCRGDATARQA